MKKPFIISVAAQSGGGKTTIVTALKERFADCGNNHRIYRKRKDVYIMAFPTHIVAAAGYVFDSVPY